MRGPLANEPTAQILHALLLVFAAWVIFLFAVDLPTDTRKVATGTLEFLSGLTAAVALLLLQKGSLRTASLVYLWGSWLIFTVLIIFNGGIHSVGAVFYVVIPTSAAWLLGYRAALGMAALCLASSLVMAILEIAGLPLPLYFPGRPLGIWNSIVGALVLAAVPVGRVLRILTAALARSRQTEAALREHQEQLEDLVRQRTAELLEARDRAEGANRAKTLFLANMSHELRTPLNAILGFSRLLRSTAASDQQRDRLDIINRSGEHLLTLIDDVLDVAKIEAGKQELAIAPCDLKSLVHEVMEMVRVRADARGLALICHRSADFPGQVLTDGPKLRQILLNLLGNAVKYTESGSITLRLSAAPAEDPRVRLRFEVADTGIGISPEDQARIFEAFVQAGRPAKVEGPGVGLGLTIARSFIGIMGGALSLVSTPGVGSVFTVELPAELTDEAAARPQTEADQRVALAPGQPEWRVLAVDDNLENAQLLSALLGAAGFQHRTASSGALAIEAFTVWRPHFIFMDLRMPVMSGAEAVKRIRAMDGGGEVKIAAITASAFASERVEVMAACMDDFILKPFRPAEIFECIARHLPVRFCRSESASAAVEYEKPSAGALLAIPGAIRAELAQAVVSLKGETIAAAIDKITPFDPLLAAGLRHLSDRLAYTALWELVTDKQSDGHSDPGGPSPTPPGRR